jgi:ribosome-binding protein aMBF1 (putative translation factor)
MSWNSENPAPGNKTVSEAGQGDVKMTKVHELHEKWMQDPEYLAEFEALEEEFSMASTLIKARTDAGLTQKELAHRMNTTQSVIARMESGRVNPSSRTLQKFARATDTKLKIIFESIRPLNAEKQQQMERM